MENINFEVINSFVLIILTVLFFTQNKRINTMKSFVDIFDIDKVKAYVELNEEAALQKAANYVQNDKKVREVTEKVVKKT